MTEGIIQKAFNPIIEYYVDYEMQLNGDDVAFSIAKLQQELIAEIEKQDYWLASELKKALIGNGEKKE